MSGEASVTGGDFSGPGGRPWRLILVITALIGAFCIVNIGSVLMEVPPKMRHFAVWEPFVWELSSLIGIVSLCLPLLWIYDQLRARRLVKWQLIGCHAVVAIGYSLAHVAIMVALRHLVYAVMSAGYDFSHGHLARQLFYEGRKDILSYCVITGIFWVDGRLRQPPHSQIAPTPVPTPANGLRTPAQRIEIREGARTLFVDPGDILLIEAAGNYVEMHVNSPSQARKTYLVRGSMSAYEAQLSATGFARVHRSRLINRSRIKSLETTTSGDVRITLDDGATIMGSRRYRENLS